jgi:hypothetical protein
MRFEGVNCIEKAQDRLKMTGFYDEHLIFRNSFSMNCVRKQIRIKNLQYSIN